MPKALSMVNAITEGNLRITYDKNIYQKAIYIKRGHFEKDIKLILNTILFKLLWVKPKDAVVSLYFYLKKSLKFSSL